MRTKFNFSMLAVTGAAAVAAFIIGEFIISKLWFYEGGRPLFGILSVGLYFGLAALLLLLAVLLWEKATGNINGNVWRQSYLGRMYKFAALGAAGILLLTGVFQFIYSFGQFSGRSSGDYIFIMDNSGSMQDNDPSDLRLDAVENIINRMNHSNRFAVYFFSGTPEKLREFSQATAGHKAAAVESLESRRGSASGNTNIKAALDMAYQDVVGQLNGRAVHFILLSDGQDNSFTNNEFNTAIEDYKQNNIVIDTVMLVDDSSRETLERLSEATNGASVYIEGAENLLEAYSGLFLSAQDRNLLATRNGAENASPGYGFLRGLLICFTGILFSVAAALVLDNKTLLAPFLIRGAVGGIIAGILMEIGLQSGFSPLIVRLLSLLAIMLVFSGWTENPADGSYFSGRGGGYGTTPDPKPKTGGNHYNRFD